MKKRINIFNQIHKGLRAMLYNAGMALQHNDFTSPEETQATFEKIQELLDVCIDHAKHEAKFIFPAVAKYPKQLIGEFESEHQVAESLIHRLGNLIAGYSYAISDDAK